MGGGHSYVDIGLCMYVQANKFNVKLVGNEVIFSQFKWIYSGPRIWAIFRTEP